ncbi:MAG: hypothetical protein K6C94_02070 [Candidatus Gastranaerophilales bacterium]|nr:hypothetical protein [Candidatus Gastranaerophilales bacterium]
MEKLMDYENFDYKEACSKYSMKELEVILFKSRCSQALAHANAMIKRNADGLVLSLIIGILALSYFLIVFIYFIYDGISYILTHDEDYIHIPRYFEVKWSKAEFQKDNSYTTLGDINRIADYIDVMKQEVIENKKMFDDDDNSDDTDYTDKETAREILKRAFKKGNVLCGVIIKTKVRLKEKSDTNRSEVQHYKCQVVSFGAEVNNAIKVLLKGKIKIYKDEENGDSYIKIFDNDRTPLIKGLKDITGLSEVRISLMRNR